MKIALTLKVMPELPTKLLLYLKSDSNITGFVASEGYPTLNDLVFWPWGVSVTNYYYDTEQLRLLKFNSDLASIL